MARKIKRKGGDSRKGLGGMLQQLQSLQSEVLKAQDEVADLVVTGTAGGGAVVTTITGERRIQTLTIAPEVVDSQDLEMLQDLVIAAVNNGLSQIDEALTTRVEALTDGLSLPGLG